MFYVLVYFIFLNFCVSSALDSVCLLFLYNIQSYLRKEILINEDMYVKKEWRTNVCEKNFSSYVTAL